MINKVVSSVEEAIADVNDGASIMIGGFAGSGTPYNLIEALVKKGSKDLTIICNTWTNLMTLPDGSQVRKIITSFPLAPYSTARPNPLEAGIRSGKIEVEVVPQGTLAERIRAGAAGIAAFYTPTGVGTVIEQGKEKKTFDGKEFILERALKADFAFVRALKGDSKGNLIYRYVMKNFNPVMAMCAKVTIAEVQEAVAPGELAPEQIETQGIFVQRVVQVVPINITPRLLPRKENK